MTVCSLALDYLHYIYSLSDRFACKNLSLALALALVSISARATPTPPSHRLYPHHQVNMVSPCPQSRLNLIAATVQGYSRCPLLIDTAQIPPEPLNAILASTTSPEYHTPPNIFPSSPLPTETPP